jgi:hypothetical protein
MDAIATLYLNLFNYLLMLSYLNYFMNNFNYYNYHYPYIYQY